MSEHKVLAAFRRARLAAFRAERLCLSAASPLVVRLRLSACANRFDLHQRIAVHLRVVFLPNNERSTSDNLPLVPPSQLGPDSDGYNSPSLSIPFPLLST